MKCLKCGYDNNLSNAKFCIECGSYLSTKIICPSCNKENPKEAKFCSECSHQLNSSTQIPKNDFNFNDYKEINKVKRKIALDFLEKGRNYLKDKNFEEAINFFERAVNEATEIEDLGTILKASGNKGIALLELGKYSEAILCFEKVIQIDRNDTNAWKYKGMAFEELGKYSESLKCCEVLIDLNPNYPNAWLYMGRILFKLKRYSEAINSFYKEISINPNNDEAWINKGLAHSMLEEFIQAIHSFDEAISIDPENTEAWFNKGLAFWTLGSNNEAINCCNEAIRLDPSNTNAIDLRDKILKEEKHRSILDAMSKSTIKVADALARTTLTVGEIALDNYVESKKSPPQDTYNFFPQNSNEYSPPNSNNNPLSQNNPQIGLPSKENPPNLPKDIANHLGPGEIVLYSTKQNKLYSGDEFYLTNRQILIKEPYRLGLKKDYIQIHDYDIIDADIKENLFSADLYIQSQSRGTTCINKVPKEDGHKIVGMIRQIIQDYKFGKRGYQNVTNVRYIFDRFSP